MFVGVGVIFMQDRDTIQEYINNFRRRLSPYLKPGMGIACSVYPAKVGAILEFSIGLNLENIDQQKEVSETVNQALKLIKQKAFGGNLEGFRFSGTNYIMEDNRVILIKGDSTEWNDVAAEKDVLRLVSMSQGVKK